MIPIVVDLAQATELGAVLVDVRWYLDGRSGHAAYLDGHLPGARFCDLEAALAGPVGPRTGRHPLPSPEQFAGAMGALGIAPETVVVAYDDQGGRVAARLVVLLRAIGQSAAVLDGGLEVGVELEAGPVSAPVVTRSAIAWPPALLVDLGTEPLGDRLLLDARATARFSGHEEPVDPVAGHIPGARNLPAGVLTDAQGRWRSPQELRADFAAVGVTGQQVVVASCGSGVTACALLLALEYAGLGAGQLYAGSWSAWCSDPSRPVALGED